MLAAQFHHRGIPASAQPGDAGGSSELLRRLTTTVKSMTTPASPGDDRGPVMAARRRGLRSFLVREWSSLSRWCRQTVIICCTQAFFYALILHLSETAGT